MIRTRILVLLLACITLLFGVVACGTSEETEDGNGNDKNPFNTDIFGPTVSNTAISEITQTGAVITWITDEPGSSQVKYGLTSNFGSVTPLDSAMVTDHRVTLTGLTQGDYWYVEPVSLDAAGNEGYSMYENFYTLLPQDLAVGASCQNSERRVTLRSVSRASSYMTSYGWEDTAEAGRVYIIADLLVENIGTPSFYVSDYDLEITDSQGFKYNPTLNSLPDAFNSVELYAGQKTQGKVVFSVPDTATGLKIGHEFGRFGTCLTRWVVS